MTEAVMTDYHKAEISDSERAMLDFAIALTEKPGDISKEHVATLRDHGFDDPAIHDIVQVAALFNYYNRIADGLGIDPEPDW